MRCFSLSLFLFLLAGLALAPSAWAREEDFSSYTADLYRAGQDYHKAIVPARDKKLIERLRRQGARSAGEYPDSTLLDVPPSALKQLKADERSRVAVREDFDRILLDAGPIHTRHPPRLSAEETAFNFQAAKGMSLHLIQCSGPIREDWVNQIDSVKGARRITYLAQNAYLLWASPEALEEIRRLPFVQWEGSFLPKQKVHPFLKRRAGRETDVTLLWVDHPEVEASLARLKRIAKRTLRPEHRQFGQVVISVTLDRSQTEELAQLPDLIGIEPYAEPELTDEVQGQITAGNLTADGSGPSGTGYLAALTALGFPTNPALYPIVDVTDDGFDNGSASTPGHPDFYELGQTVNPSRIVYAVDRTADGKPHGVGGHGTLNAAIVGGYNSTSGFPHEDGGGYQLGLGLAPYGRLASSKIFRDSGSFGLIGSFTSLVSNSYALGTRISTNSWGSSSGGDYGAMDQEYDALVRDAQPGVASGQAMVTVFAAGNDGPGLRTTGSPGNAKNVITVGAAENVRTAGTDGCGVTNASADNAQEIASFSSRGPTTDGRIKPDVVAPGTHIQGAASQDPAFNGSGVCGSPTGPYFPAGQTLYTWSSGTSHSTPAAAGAAALLYQRFQSETGSPPSPAMVKAMLVNATRYLTGTGAGGNLPSNSQGWGEMEFTDFLNAARVAQDQTRLFSSSGESSVVTGAVADSAKPVKVALTWTDPPGPTVGAAYVNDLNLEVTAGGRLYLGNHFNGAFSSEGGAADPRNNVEAVFLPAGTSGNIAARIRSITIAGDGVPGNADPTDQDFALSIQNVTGSSLPVLQVTAVTLDDSAGNGNGLLDPGETATLQMELKNDGIADATGITAALSTSTAGVTVTQTDSGYPNLAPDAAVLNSTPFRIRADSGVACGTLIQFTLSLQTGQGSFILPAALRVGDTTLLFHADFEGDDSGFDAVGLWHRETGCSAALGGHSPATTFYYGRAPQCDYDIGANSGTLTSPEIDLTDAAGPITLSFNHFLEREPGYLGSFDIARAEISKDGGAYSTLEGPYDSTGGVFETASADLSGYAGSKIRLRWLFNTVDGSFNNYEGWHVDDIQVEGIRCHPVVNRAPVLDPIGDKTVDEGQLLQFTLTGSDPDGDTVTFSASNLPAGAAFSGGAFSWTPGFDQAGSYPNVHFEATDGSLTDSEEITLTANNAPPPASSISGTVTRTSGQDLPDASMTLVKRNVKPSFKRTTKTNSSGRYQFSDLTSGQYDVTASKKGYGSLRTRVNLGSPEDKTVDFVLKLK